jgi:hypothetical protein
MKTKLTKHYWFVREGDRCAVVDRNGKPLRRWRQLLGSPESAARATARKLEKRDQVRSPELTWRG